MRVQRLAALLAMVAIVSALTPAPTMAAQPSETGSHCSEGVARSLLEAFPVFFHYQPPQFEYPKCQVRVFWDGFEATFGEEDWFLVGNVLFAEYLDLGQTRHSAIAFLESIEERLWLSEMLSGGQLSPQVELDMIDSNYKDFVSPIFGHVVYQSTGVILQLPPGDYLLHYEAKVEGELFTSEVTVHIVPSS